MSTFYWDSLYWFKRKFLFLVSVWQTSYFRLVINIYKKIGLQTYKVTLMCWYNSIYVMQLQYKDIFVSSLIELDQHLGYGETWADQTSAGIRLAVIIQRLKSCQSGRRCRWAVMQTLKWWGFLKEGLHNAQCAVYLLLVGIWWSWLPCWFIPAFKVNHLFIQ